MKANQKASKRAASATGGGMPGGMGGMPGGMGGMPGMPGMPGGMDADLLAAMQVRVGRRARG